jgi:hypothetical protein
VRGLLSLILLCSVGVSVCGAQQSPADSQQHTTTEMQKHAGHGSRHAEYARDGYGPHLDELATLVA